MLAPTFTSSIPAPHRQIGSIRRLIRRWLGFVSVFLLLGLAVSVLVAWACAALIDVLDVPKPNYAELFQGDLYWGVTTWSKAGARLIGSTRIVGRDWSPAQATGAPDAAGGTDSVKAWASASSDGQAEWLTLDYANAVVPKQIDVYESYCPGALSKITVFTEQGKEVEVWSGVDPTPRGSAQGVSHIPVNVNVKTQRLKLYLDSQLVSGWNEVDAVALIDWAGQSQWATEAVASSWYGDGRVIGNPTVPMPVVPTWSGLDRPLAPMSLKIARREDRAIDMRGWPMLAMWCERDETAAASVATASGQTGGMGSYSFTASGRFVRGTGLANSGLIPAVTAGTSSSGALPTELPLRPIWGGLAFNSIFYAMILAGIYWALTVPRRFVREVSRIRSGRCLQCGYELHYDFVHGCPECGWRRGPSDQN